MKKGFKRFLCAFLAVLMLAAAMPMGLSLPSFAAADGLAFKQKLIYSLDAPLADAPLTFTATVKIADTVAVPGVIFGNYKNDATSYINFEIFENGVPGLSFTNAEGTVTTVLFEETDVRTGEFVNLTVVFAEGESVSLYVDGVLAKTVATTASYADDAATASDFVVGGDSEDKGTVTINDDNSSYFQGNIKSLALYSTALTETEVAAIYADGVDVTDGDILACYDMTASKVGRIEDLSGNGCNATSFYHRYKDPDEYAYSFAVVGDTQSAVYADVNRAWTKWKDGTYATYEEAIAAQKRMSYPYDWIVENKNSKKIEYVFGVGDITEWKNTVEWTWDHEFTHAKNHITKLDAAGIPYALVPGDHDEANRYNGYYTQDGTRDYSKYNSYVGDLLADRVSGYYAEGEYASYYINFNVGDTQYMLLALEVAAPNRVLDWANEVVAAHPDRRVIITTHSFMYSDGTRVGTDDEGTHNYTGADGENVRNNGEQMWDEFVKLHSNIVMVLSGHIVSSDLVWRQDKGVNGNTVTQILVNPQYMDPNYGMVCMLYFSEDGSDVQAEWISTGPNEYNMGYPSYKIDYLYKMKNQFSFSLIEDGKSKVSAFTDKNAILANKKLLTNGLQIYSDYNSWVGTEATKSIGFGTYADTASTALIYGSQGHNAYSNSRSFLYFAEARKNDSAAGYPLYDAGNMLADLGNGNQAAKIDISSGNYAKNAYQIALVGNSGSRANTFARLAKDFAGQTFVYQTDFRVTAFDAHHSGLIQAVSHAATSKVTNVLVTLNTNGELAAGGGILKDKDGNSIKLSKDEFTTLAVIVNPQLNKYWVAVNGYITSEAGYTFMTEAQMKTLVNANDATATYLYDEDTGNFLDKDGNVTESPVPYGYILGQIESHTNFNNKATYYYDNTMLYFVDQTYTYEDYLAMVSPVAGNTATLGSEIGYNYYLDLSDSFLAENPSLEVKFEVNGKSETFAVAGATVTDYDVDGDGKADTWRKITCNVAAAEMTREIKMTLYQGSTVYYTDTATVKEYADIIIKGDNEAAANVAKSMLVYGAYAQQYFGVDTDKPAIDVTGAELKELPTEKQYGIEGTKFNYLTSTLALQSETIICHYFDEADGLTFTLDGEELTAVADGGRFRVDIAVDAVNLDTVYALVVSDGINSYTINYSAVGYAQMAVNDARLTNLVKALYTYNVYADAYSVS